MKTLTSPLTAQIGAEQLASTLLFDFYLKSAIVTPYGTTDKIRITKYPGGYTFFTPKIAPEPVGTRGAAQAYIEWPIEKGTVQSSATHGNDQMTLTLSNVSKEYAGMLNHDEWRDVPVVIRQVSPSIVSPTADDCAVVFSGNIDDATIVNETIQFTLSNDLVGFDLKIPRENMHRGCRFRWGDDMCGAVRLAPANYQSKTCGAACTTTVINSAGLTEDTWSRGATPTDEVDALPNGSITASDYRAPGTEPYGVKISNLSAWQAEDFANWGDANQGYWAIKVAQEGLANAALRPWIQFDFGSAKAMKVWTILPNSDIDRERLVRLVSIYSSPDAVTWTLERHFECAPLPNTGLEIPVHAATAKRYWRMSIRTRWTDTNYYLNIQQIHAYTVGKYWWADGMITFDAATTTASLRGLRRRIIYSYAGSMDIVGLPVAPVIGDVFTIERGCPRTFNGCAERLNWPNFGGYDSIPFETIVR